MGKFKHFAEHFRLFKLVTGHSPAYNATHRVNNFHEKVVLR